MLIEVMHRVLVTVGLKPSCCLLKEPGILLDLGFLFVAGHESLTQEIAVL